MEPRARAREHVPALAGVLSVVSLAVVFAAALRTIPAGVLPRADGLLRAVPHLNAGISAVAIGSIAAGVRWARRGRYRRHRAAMATTFVLFVAFLALYLYRVSVLGPTPFPGESGALAAAYHAILAVHVLLAVVCVPLVYYVLLLAATRPIEAVFETAHSRGGRVAATLWSVSFALGLVVYGLLYRPV
jgi:putative membrane protein